MRYPVAQEIIYLTELANKLSPGLPELRVTDFKHTVIGSGFLTLAGGVAVPPTGDCHIFTYRSRPGNDFIVTHISVKSYVDSATANIATEIGPWDFEGYDARGYGSLRLEVDRRPIMATPTIWNAVANRPVLFAFNGGNRIDVIVNRLSWDNVYPGFPESVIMVCALNAYLLPPGQAARFAAAQSQMFTIAANGILVPT